MLAGPNQRPNCAAVCYVGNRMRSFRDRFLRPKQSQVFCCDNCCSFAFCLIMIAARGITRSALLATQTPKIQRRKGWIRSLRTIAILNRLACFCFRMQPAGVEQGSLHAALLSHSERFWLVSQERALRRAPLCLPHRVATRARRAWLPGSPCVRALATRVLRAWPL